MDHSQQLCPYLERQDTRCAGVLTLTNLHDAMGRCSGDHQFCATYHRIRHSDLTRHYLEVSVAKSA